MVESDRIPAISTTDADHDNVVLGVVFDIGERESLGRELVAILPVKDLDGDVPALILLGQGLQDVMPLWARQLFAARCLLAHVITLSSTLRSA
jgi:hypothetical protein